MYTSGQRQILTNMFAGVQGVYPQIYPQQAYQTSPNVYDPRLGYPTQYFPQFPTGRTLSISHGQTIVPSFAANQLSDQSASETTYLRPLGTTPGTLERMKRIVDKQKSCYGLAIQYISDA